MVKLSDLFYIYTGSKLDFDKQQLDDNGINFVSRNSNNNGVVGRIIPDENTKIFKRGDITVPLGGSYLLSAFVQDEDFVTAQNVDVLRPKKYMTDIQKWFYCYVLRENRFKFSAFGREVNKYIQDIEVPDEFPEWINDTELSLPKTDNINNNTAPIDFSNWEYFQIKKLFKIERGTITSLNELEPGLIPIVSATDKNQGIAYYGNVSAKYINCLTASFNGVGTGYISYHDYSFNANTDCGILIPKFNEFNTYIALFITTVMNQFKYKYSYGRKLSQERLAEEYIKLPIACDENGNPIIDKNKHLSELGYIPDWKYMENYMKDLPYGDIL